MARIKVLELPMRHVGTFTETPFAIIIDESEEGTYTEAALADFKTSTGAAAILVTEGTLDIDHG